MPRRFRRRMVMKAPIVSFKHQRQEKLTYTGAGVNNNYLVYQGTNQGTQTTPTDIPNGNKCYSVNVSVNYVSGTGSATGAISWMLVHLRDGQTISDQFAGVNASDWSTIGLSKAKNQVIESHIGVFATEDAGAKTWNRHIKLPKMWHRVREGDQLVLMFNADEAGTLNIGGRFKSYS